MAVRWTAAGVLVGGWARRAVFWGSHVKEVEGTRAGDVGWASESAGGWRAVRGAEGRGEAVTGQP